MLPQCGFSGDTQHDLWVITSPVFFLFLRWYLLGLYSHFTESTQCPLGDCLCWLGGKVHRQKQIPALETGMESLADEVYQGWLRSRRVWSPEGFWQFGRMSVMSWVGTRMHCRGARYCFSVLCIVLLQSQMLSPSYDPNSTLRHARSARSMGTWLRVTNESFLSIPKNRDEFKCGHVSHEGSTQSSSESLRERGALSSTWDNECQSLLHYPALMSSQQVYHPKWPILSFVFLFHICILHENISSGRAGSALSCSLLYNQCLEQRLANSKCVLLICWMTKLYIPAEGLPGVTLLQPRRAEKRERAGWENLLQHSGTHI